MEKIFANNQQKYFIKLKNFLTQTKMVINIMIGKKIAKGSFRCMELLKKALFRLSYWSA